MYLRDNEYCPIGCVAISLNKSKTQIRYQLSVLNPIDKFERSLSRHIALGRLLESPVRINGSSFANSKHYEITEAVMQSIVQNKDLPGRARKAARLWLKYDNAYKSFRNVQPMV